MTIKGTDTINPKGKEPLMRSHGIVLERQEKTGYRHMFRHADSEPHTVVHLHETDWRDMGEPDEITVTIEPGNMLQKRFEEWQVLNRPPVVGEYVKFSTRSGAVEGTVEAMVPDTPEYHSFRFVGSGATYAWREDAAKYWQVKTATIKGG